MASPGAVTPSVLASIYSTFLAPLFAAAADVAVTVGRPFLGNSWALSMKDVAKKNNITSTTVELPPINAISKPKAPAEPVYKHLNERATERLQDVLAGKSDEVLLSKEDLTDEVSATLGYFLSKRPVKISRLLLRGCGINATATIEIRIPISDGDFRKESLSFPTALSRLWFTHSDLTTVDLADNELSTVEVERLLKSLPHFAPMVSICLASESNTPTATMLKATVETAKRVKTLQALQIFKPSQLEAVLSDTDEETSEMREMLDELVGILNEHKSEAGSPPSPSKESKYECVTDSVESTAELREA